MRPKIPRNPSSNRCSFEGKKNFKGGGLEKKLIYSNKPKMQKKDTLQIMTLSVSSWSERLSKTYILHHHPRKMTLLNGFFMSCSTPFC